MTISTTLEEQLKEYLYRVVARYKAGESYKEEYKAILALIRKHEKVGRFPPTPTKPQSVGIWRVGIDEIGGRIYFWDGYSPAFNFFYKTK